MNVLITVKKKLEITTRKYLELNSHYNLFIRRNTGFQQKVVVSET